MNSGYACEIIGVNSVVTVAGICNTVGGGVFSHATVVAVPVANIRHGQG